LLDPIEEQLWRRQGSADACVVGIFLIQTIVIDDASGTVRARNVSA